MLIATFYIKVSFQYLKIMDFLRGPEGTDSTVISKYWPLTSLLTYLNYKKICNFKDVV